jgi:plasmid stabilization system protein ParE
MPKQIIWSFLAENDFAKILDYLEKNWEKKVAAHFIDLTENIINQIALNPKQFPISYKRKNVRKCVLIKQNTLYYRDTRSKVEILRIYDSRQDPDTLTFK